MVIELNDSSYPTFIESTNDVVFIDFYSPMCGPCQELLPLLDKLDNYYENSEVTIAKVNVREAPRLAQKYQISGVPFCAVIGKDKMVKEVEMGLSHPDRYFTMIDKALGTHKSFFQKIIEKFKS